MTPSGLVLDPSTSGSHVAPRGLNELGLSDYSELAGTSWNDGLLRFHDADSSADLTDSICQAFGKAVPSGSFAIAYDWSARQIFVEVTRARLSRKISVTLRSADIATGQLDEVASPSEFLQLLQYAEWTEAFNEDPYRRYLEQSGGAPLGWSEVIGFAVPPFLGGGLGLDNFERIDASVYWGLSSQLFAQARRA